MIYGLPGSSTSKISYKSKYDNFIGGKFVPPVKQQYFDVITPISGQVYTRAARSTAEDIELALDAAHKAFESWSKTSVTERANILLKIADRLEQNLELLAYAETVDNGKPIRETLNADIPLSIDHFRYFAGCLRILIMAELIADILPAGVLNIVNGFGREAGMPLATSKRIAKIAFTGSTSTGRVIAQAAANSLIPATLELGGKSPNLFFADIADHDDDFFDKAIEGLVLFAFNQGEVCTCPSRAIIHESIYDKFMARVLERVAAINQGNPLDVATMMGAQASKEQLDKIKSYLDLGRQEGAKVLIGGSQAQLPGDLAGGYYVQPTLFLGHNKMRIFQEEIFGPVLAVTTFKTEEQALEIANDSLYGLGAGVWTRNGNLAYKMGRGIKAGRVWTNCYHAYPAHAAFGGYKESGIGRETHKMMLNHYQQTKNLLVSYSPKKLGFF